MINLQHNINVINEEPEKINMTINVNKTKIMVISNTEAIHNIKVECKNLEQIAQVCVYCHRK